MTYDKPITIQVRDPDTEDWVDKLRLHARVNKSSGNTAFSAGADQFRVSLTFWLRYVKALEEMAYSPQPYRILYRGRTYRVVDYDDFMEQHREIKLVGEFYE